MSPTTQTHIVGNLKKHTKYEFFIAPFYRSVEGQPSNSKIVQTFEDGKWDARLSLLFPRSLSLHFHVPILQFHRHRPITYRRECWIWQPVGFVGHHRHRNTTTGFYWATKFRYDLSSLSCYNAPLIGRLSKCILSISFIGFGPGRNSGTKMASHCWNAKCQMQMQIYLFSPLFLSLFLLLHSFECILLRVGAFDVIRRMHIIEARYIHTFCAA